ncbi:hypothetical protein F5148DRAFT_1283413 [Russula earlei]|uniref:Uncharacterized protein n=1 Tax=Russula earlei TaxID=71964 RepID=A0ACC0UBB0_9AGAM|nr:hypothetical protein F5148DRAFT_1283413 [Russula earlei]
MVNFHDPAVILQDRFAVVKFWHVVDGLYIWEFLTNISYDWDVIRGRRRHGWTIWIYCLTRLATLAAVIINIVILDVTTPINCHASFVTQFIFAYLSLAAASFLIVLTELFSIAIWSVDKVVSSIAAITWVVNVSFLIQGKSLTHSILRIRSAWVPGGCIILNTRISKLNITVTLVTDIVLFLIMLLGLLRLRLHRGGTMALGRLLWKQGVIWFLIGAAAEVPAMVFIHLNLNDPLNLMFQVPCLITMAIAATRMYRSLAEFLSSDILSEGTSEIDLTIPNRITLPHAPVTQLEMAMYTAHEEYLKS